MFLKEQVDKELDAILLTEGVETKNMKAAKHYLYDKFGYDEQQAMRCIGQIKTDIPNSRLGKCKFMLAMVRMFSNQEFNNGQIIMQVNQCLKFAASNAHINEYDQDLNGLSAAQFIERFATSVQQDLEQDKTEVNSQQYDTQNSQYQIVRINSFYDAHEYGDYVEWCVTHDVSMFESYTSNGEGVFYFCLRNGFEDEAEERGENCPLDSYGLSMIAVSVNKDGSCNTITCRWNHDNGGNDNIMTPKQLSQIINRNFYETFKPLTPEEIKRNLQIKIQDIENEIESQIFGGDSLEDFCTSFYCDEDEGDKDERTVFGYSSDNGCVLLDYEGQFIIDDVFTHIGQRRGDILTVEKGNKTNFITLDGDYVSDVWYDAAYNLFDQGFATVRQNNKCNLLNKEGMYLLKKWYDGLGCGIAHRFKNTNVIEVIDNNKSVFVNINSGESIFPKSIDRYEFYDMEHSAFLNEQTRTYILIKFDNENFYQFYDLQTGRCVAPYQIEAIVGRYNYDKAPYVKLINDKTYYILCPNGDLAIKDENSNKAQIVKKNPFNQQQINENYKLINIISEKIFNQLASLYEVRYIDTKSEKYGGLVKKGDWKDVYQQEPIKNTDKIRVYHGCTLKTALDWALHGTSGREWHPRTYSYEGGMNPLGIFVTVDFEKAKEFGYDTECKCIVEFTASANDLESPVWNNSNSYFGQGTNPMPFKNKEERNAQKQKYDDEARNVKDFTYRDYVKNKEKTISYDYIRKSDKPAMAKNIFDNPEHQALFMGNLNPNMIKRIWINAREEGKNYVSTSNAYVPLKVKEFVQRFKDKEFYIEGSQNQYAKLTTNKIYKPNDNFNGFEDYFERYAKLGFPFSDKGKESVFNELNNNNEHYKKMIANAMFPKQIVQAFGQEFFDKHFNRFGQ